MDKKNRVLCFGICAILRCVFSRMRYDVYYFCTMLAIPELSCVYEIVHVLLRIVLKYYTSYPPHS
jgi:hypothetical protein